jgi:hypothetical protein
MTPKVLETISLQQLVERTAAYNYDLKKAGIHARFVQVNTRAKGPVRRVTPGYSVWTEELSGYGQRELWWCCHGGHEIEILDQEQPITTRTSNW